MARVLVLGAGRQGTACAFDLVQSPDIDRVTLADLRGGGLPGPLARSPAERLTTLCLDATDARALGEAVAASDAVCCALPYFFNAAAARAAVDAGVHYCDLGGNTSAVREQMKLDEEATRKGVSVIPDCGLAPGLVNVLAAEGIRRVERARSVRLFVGGLPAQPRPPLNYQIVYSLRGLLDYYTTPATVLRDGRRREVEALSEVEEIDFGPPLGRLEAFHTAGGVSTLPWTWEGMLETLEYKTLRYPGHAAIITAIRDLGLLSTDPVDIHGTRIVPRDLFVAVAEPHLRWPGTPDVVALLVTVSGSSGGQEEAVAWRLLCREDPATGLSGMERVTGFSLAIVCRMQLDGRIRQRGVATPDRAVPAAPYLFELARRGLAVQEISPPR